MQHENGTTLMFLREALPIEVPVQELKVRRMKPEESSKDTAGEKPDIRKKKASPANGKIPAHWVMEAERIDLKINTTEWRILGLLIAAMYEEDGRALFLALSLNNTDWPDDTEEIINSHYDEFQDQSDPAKSSRNAVVQALMKAGLTLRKYPDPPRGAFWEVVVSYSDTGEPIEKLIIKKERLYKETLTHLGFYIDEDGELVQEVAPGMLKYDVSTLHIKQALLKFISEQAGALYDPLFEFVLKLSNMPAKSNLEYLPMKKFPLLQSTAETVYHRFQDGILSTDRKSKKRLLKPYSDLQGTYVPVDAIIPINFSDLSPDRGENAVFREFVKDVSIDFDSTIRGLGYLLDDFKDEANPRAIIIVDSAATLDGNSHGGTGKDLLVQGVIKLIPIVTKIMGKNFDPNRPFSLQRYKKGSSILWLEDPKKGFQEEALYIMVSSSLEIEQKHKMAILIPANMSPKLVVTTNFSLSGTGSSSKRRFYIFELKSFFDNNHTPYDEYGHRFFSEWGHDEWINFYSFMIFEVLDSYLKYGLERGPYPENYRRNQVIQGSSEEFFDFCESIDLNEHQPESDIADLRNKFLKISGEAAEKKIKSNPSIFSKWLKVYVQEYLLMTLKTRKSDSKTLYQIEKH